MPQADYSCVLRNETTDQLENRGAHEATGLPKFLFVLGFGEYKVFEIFTSVKLMGSPHNNSRAQRTISEIYLLNKIQV